MFKTRNELLEKTRTVWLETLGKHNPEYVYGHDNVRTVLFKLQDLIESERPKDDYWMEVANWSFGQSISVITRHKNPELGPRDIIQRVKIKTFDRFMCMNLRNNTWFEERPIWHSLPKIPWDR